MAYCVHWVVDVLTLLLAVATIVLGTAIADRNERLVSLAIGLVLVTLVLCIICLFACKAIDEDRKDRVCRIATTHPTVVVDPPPPPPYSATEMSPEVYASGATQI
jgi:hypothetical protein